MMYQRFLPACDTFLRLCSTVCVRARTIGCVCLRSAGPQAHGLGGWCAESCCDNKVEKELLDTMVGNVMGLAVSLAGCGEVALTKCGMSAAEESKCRQAMEGFSDCWVKQEIEDKTNATHYCTYMQEVYKCFPSECAALSAVCPLLCPYSDDERGKMQRNAARVQSRKRPWQACRPPTRHFWTLPAVASN